MKIPPGMTIVIGRHEYHECMELPANASQELVKRIEKWYAEQKKDTSVKNSGSILLDSGIAKPSEGGKL